MIFSRRAVVDFLKRKLPILVWLPKYRANFLLLDFIAGFTVGLTTIPQAIAYGVIAGLEPQHGLYAAFMGCFVYIVFGSCKDVTIATTAIMALMIHPYATLNVDYCAFVSFFAGCIIVTMGLLNLGFLVTFISVPVVSGFTTAAACTIASAQINNLFGISSPSKEFTMAWTHFFTHLYETRLADALLGVSTLTLLLLVKKMGSLHGRRRAVLKYMSLSSNALAVIIGSVLAFGLSRDGAPQPFRVTGDIRGGLPPIRAPPFSTNVNGTYVPLTGMFHTVGVSLATVPLVAILEIVAISKAFCKGKIVDASQQMVALGMCNIFGSFFGAMPVTGSFTRTAVNNASGVKTPLGGAATGILVLLSLAFLTQTFYFMPKSTLAAIIIAAMVQIVELKRILHIWKSKKLDLVPFAVTFLTCLLWSLEYGILCGVATNLSFTLYNSARPRIQFSREEIDGVHVGRVAIKERLNYAAAEYFKAKIIGCVSKQVERMQLIIIDGREIHTLDYTVAINILSLLEDLRVLNCDVIFWNWKHETRTTICSLNADLQSAFITEKSVSHVVAEYEMTARYRKNETPTDMA